MWLPVFLPPAAFLHLTGQPDEWTDPGEAQEWFACTGLLLRRCYIQYGEAKYTLPTGLTVAACVQKDTFSSMKANRRAL